MTRLCLSIRAEDRPGLLRDLAAVVAARGVNIEQIHHLGGTETSMHLELQGAELEGLAEEIGRVVGVREVSEAPSAASIFGKRVIVIGGGAQVAQVVLGAVSEADRHNLRGERISVDTIALVGESTIADAVRAVGRLPRASILVLAGSLMGGDITVAVRELRERYGVPVVSLRMAGSVPSAADLVVSDPVQAGVVAVMAIASTAKFDLARVHNETF
jgi:energy-converting hydrogenase B subunit Q